MVRDIERVLIDRQTIAKRVRELAAQIGADLQQEAMKAAGGHFPSGAAPESALDGKVMMVPVLTGSVVFVADLIRELPHKLSLEMVAVSSYPGASMESKGAKLRGVLPSNMAGKHVLLVDDILDSGQTLDLLTKLIAEHNPASLRVCVLLRKPGKAKVDVKAHYVGFDIPDEFVVGYGLDFDGFYRNYPEIATLKREAITGEGR
jgi:hypoxanthine phosphoribosyltransferase